MLEPVAPLVIPRSRSDDPSPRSQSNSSKSVSCYSRVSFSKVNMMNMHMYMENVLDGLIVHSGMSAILIASNLRTEVLLINVPGKCIHVSKEIFGKIFYSDLLHHENAIGKIWGNNASYMYRMLWTI